MSGLDTGGLAAAAARVQQIQQRLASVAPPAARPSFAALLQPAPAAPVAAPAAGTASAAWQAAVQRPAALAQAAPTSYPNGQLPASALRSIGGGERLQPAAADAFLRLRDAATAAGVDLPVNDSYRSLAEQQRMADTKGLYSQGGLAARPGTSTHGLGLSVDLQLDSGALAWMRANGERFDFHEDVAREPWHWTYEPQREA